MSLFVSSEILCHHRQNNSQNYGELDPQHLLLLSRQKQRRHPRISTGRFSSPTPSGVSRIKSEETLKASLIVGIRYYLFVFSFK
jgi:hypothetical protein